MVEVAVIGAGAAGLVAARHFLWNKCGTGSVANHHLHIFERRGWVGGAWSSRGGRSVGKSKDSLAISPVMWENLTPNLSKYTCRFSDFTWQPGTPAFPSRADMQKYLEDYADHFILQNEHCTLHYECTVTNVQKSDDNTYKLYWKNGSDVDKNNSFCKAFDNVIVASGYFASPLWPDGIMNLVENTENRTVIHSSQYQSPEEFTDQTVCVIGGSFSSQEIASDVARHAKRVVNVLGTDMNHSVPYILPRFVQDPKTGFVVPLDVLLYRRSERQVAPAIPERLVLDEEEIRKRHDFLRNLVGNRFFEQLKAKGIPEPSVSTYPFVSISDEYANLVVDGKIEVIPWGRMEKAEKCYSNGSETITVTLDNGSRIEGMDRIISCTGYRSHLDFLDAEILQTLEYDPSDSFAPLTLCHDAFHPKLPGLGFVGQYKGAYFGYMELQARLLAGIQNGQVDLGNHDDNSYEVAQKLLEHSRKIRQQLPRPQFPHFDYVGAMDSVAERVQLTPEATTFGAKGQMVTPAYYQPDKELAKQCQEELEHEMQNQVGAKIAKLALNSMIGKWKFRRTITDHLTCSNQDVHGEVSFCVLRESHSLRYREDGHMELPNGNRLEVFREYDYVWNQGSGDLDIMFVENSQQTYLFMSLRFQKQENGYWLASSDHLCIKDLYTGTFQIKLDGIRAKEIIMTYHVKGPKKDYESITYLSPTIY